MGQTKGGSTTNYALDVVGLPEVIYTSDDNAYLHLPGVIVTESAAGEVRYLLSDGLGSVRQVVDETAQVVSYQEFDPYGNPTLQSSSLQPYGFTGEWWQDEIDLLHLRARWYAPQTGTFLNRDPLFNTSQYGYASGNPINRVDPSGYVDWNSCVATNGIASCPLEFNDSIWGIAREVIAIHGIDQAFNFDNDRINEYIRQSMAIAMWNLNPNLHPVGLNSPPEPSTPKHDGWHCPACPKHNPSGRINLPQSWLPKGVVAPPPPDGLPDFPPLTIIPPQPTPTPAPSGSTLGSSSPIGPGVPQYDGPTQGFQEDGVVFGISTSTQGPGNALGSLLTSGDLPQVKFNDVCLVATGQTDGTEIVYDFKHQERGYFTYTGLTFNPTSLVGVGTTTYVGKTRGFAKFDPLGWQNSYDIGVRAYAGKSKSTAFSVVYDNLGPIIIEGEPLLDQNNYVNPNGVFATYYGIGLGQSVSLPASGEITVANYNLKPGDRERYLSGIPLNKEAIFRQKTDLGNRTRVAIEMEKEIKSKFIPYWYLNVPPFTPLRDQILVDLWRYVDDPLYSGSHCQDHEA